MRIVQEKDLRYSFTLRNLWGRECGCIDANHHDNYITLDRFCVACKYRGSRHRYGKQLLDAIIKEAKSDGVLYILVTPKAEEVYDNVEQMELPDLYRKYLNLGFEFKDSGELKAYGNVMRMFIKYD